MISYFYREKNPAYIPNSKNYEIFDNIEYSKVKHGSLINIKKESVI